MLDEYYSDTGWMGYGAGAKHGTVDLALTQQEHAFLTLPLGLLFASELFQGRYARRRERVRDYAIRSTCTDRVLYYSGVCLDQFDLDVFLACARHFPRQSTSAPLTQKLDLRALTRDVLRCASESAQQRVVESLRRLESGRIKVWDGRFTCYFQFVQKAMFDTMENLCLIELNPEVLRSLQTLVNHQAFIQERFRLRMTSIDRWLHGVLYSSSKICIPFGSLPALSGNSKAQPVQVGKSLDRLRASVRLDHLSVLEGGLEISRNTRSARGVR